MERIRCAQKARKRGLTLYRSRRTNSRSKRQCTGSEHDTGDMNSTVDTDVEIVDKIDSEHGDDIMQSVGQYSSSDDTNEESDDNSSSSTYLPYEVSSDDFSDPPIMNRSMEEREQYTERCLTKLTNKEMWQEIVTKLYDSNNLDDFMIFIKALHNGELPMDNIVLLLMLERAKFGAIDNTVGMRYRGVTKLFWSIVYRLCKSTGLKFFSGSKHWGTVVAKECAKSKYPGHRSSINFAVPDEKMLRNLRCKLPKVLNPGIIHPALDLLTNQEDIILMADGKLLSKGLGDNFTGDVNLFGHEQNPNLECLKEEVMKNLTFIADSLCCSSTNSNMDKYTNITDIATIVTKLIQRIRNYMTDKMEKLKTSERNDTISPKTISKLRTDIYSACLWVKKARNINSQLLNLLAELASNKNLFTLNSPVDVTLHGNCRLLRDPMYIMQHVEATDFSHLFKRGSDIFVDIENQSLIPAGEAYTLMGLDKVKTMKQSFKVHFTQEIAKDREQISDYQANLDAWATTACIFMPAYLPSCSLMYEDGIRTKDGQNQSKLFSCLANAIIRHHHGTNVEQLRCSHDIHIAHENCCVLFNTDPACIGNVIVQQLPSDKEIIKAIFTMRITEKLKCLYVTVGNVSVSYTWILFDNELWDDISNVIQEHYDVLQPKIPANTSEIKSFFRNKIATFKKEYCRQICEVPRLNGMESEIASTDKFSAYSTPILKDKVPQSVLLEDDFETLCYDVSSLLEEGFNHLRVEASEIIAFVATNPSRCKVTGIPPHLPIAYGLRGHSLSMETMRSMLNDILGELDKRNINVLCEVYDGQFHKLITRSKDGLPLTRLQFQQDFFKRTMQEYDKRDLLNIILPYSDIDPDDISELYNLPFTLGTIELASICLHMNQQGNTRSITISSISIGNFTFKDFQTKFRKHLWDKLMNPDAPRGVAGNVNMFLTTSELTDMIRGTRLHRQIQFNTQQSNDSETEEDSTDEDYFPSTEDEDSFEVYEENSINISTISNLSTASTTFDGDTCLQRILTELRKLRRNKHNWGSVTTNGFLRNYLSSNASISKLFLYEMDVINAEIFRSYGKSLFNSKDKKATRVDKIANQLAKIPNLFILGNNDLEEQYSEPSSLKMLCEEYVLSKLYPKEYLVAPVCELRHDEEVRRWERNSPVKLNISDRQAGIQHIPFNFPEFNTERNKIEMRTFDYTHILNNLRFHICNKGFEGVSPEAFIKISDNDNDILPRAIVEDKLDRQNASISQRFFSAEVEEALRDINCKSEADFVHVTRNWYNACDKRGIGVIERLKYLRDMYHYLLNWYKLSDYPPQTTHVRGMPIRTFEALLHTISSRFILYGLSKSKSYNNRAISTLAVESFFSDLNRYEFSGLGSPKSVDIPKLLSHIVHVNTTKHNPNRGFEFVTSMRDNYPCYLMEMQGHEDEGEVFASCAFDVIDYKRNKRPIKLFSLSKPKSITRGKRGIRELFRIDESRLTAEQRLGKKVDITSLNF